jgi:hypothetical protein
MAILGMLFAHNAIIDYRGGYCFSSLSTEEAKRIAEQRFEEDMKCTEPDCAKYFDQPQTMKYCNLYPENSFAVPTEVNCTVKNTIGTSKFEDQAIYSVSRCGRIRKIMGYGNYEN